MRKIFIVSLVLGLSTISAISLRLAMRPVRSGDLVVDTNIKSLGRLRQGAEVSVEFLVANDTDREITIDRVLSSCACTSAKVDLSKLMPGETTKCGATYHARDSRGRTHTSLQLLYRIGTDPKTQSKILRIAADVEPDFDVFPETTPITFGNLSSITLRLVSRHVDDFKVESVRATHPAFTATVKPGYNVNEYYVTIAFSRSRWPVQDGQSSPGVIVRTNSPNQPELMLPLAVVPEGKPGGQARPLLEGEIR
jgi:hypothetical protein